MYPDPPLAFKKLSTDNQRMLQWEEVFGNQLFRRGNWKPKLLTSVHIASGGAGTAGFLEYLSQSFILSVSYLQHGPVPNLKGTSMSNRDLEIDVKDIYMTLAPIACTLLMQFLFYSFCPLGSTLNFTKLMLIPGPVNCSIITPAVAFLITADCLQWVLIVLAQIPERVPETHLEDSQGQNEFPNMRNTVCCCSLILSSISSVVCQRLLNNVQIEMGWTQEKVWDSSCLLLSQVEKRFAQK